MTNPNDYSDEQSSKPERPKSVFACLNLGFDLVARHPALLLPPLLLDVFLWLGPRLSIPVDPATLSMLLQNIGAQDISASALQDFWTNYNLFYALNPAPVLGMPSLMAHIMPAEAPIARSIWSPTSEGMGWVLYVLLLVLGLGLNAAYLQRIARTLLAQSESPLPGPQAWPIMAVRLIGLAALEVPFILLGIGVLMLLAIGALPQGLGTFLFSAVFVAGIYLGMHLILAVPALFTMGQRPMHALRDALLLVQVDFFSVLVLYGLSFVLYEGLNFLWAVPAPSSWLLLVSIAGHAFIATGLTATLFVFYTDRIAYISALQKAFANARTQVSVSRHT